MFVGWDWIMQVGGDGRLAQRVHPDIVYAFSITIELDRDAFRRTVSMWIRSDSHMLHPSFLMAWRFVSARREFALHETEQKTLLLEFSYFASEQVGAIAASMNQ